MAEPSAPVCITCSLPVGEPLRLNHLPSGQACPTCRDRLLAALPPIFPARAAWTAPEELSAEPEQASAPKPRSRRRK
jgi:hypothetical protein